MDSGNRINNQGTILEAKHLERRFGGIFAVYDLSFDLNRNEVTALIGPNGAGKSTTINLISGLYPLTSGKIVFQGKDISRLKPFRIAFEGITRTFQQPQIVQKMTALENVMVGLHTRTRSEFITCLLHFPRSIREEKLAREEGYSLLQFFKLDKKAFLPGSNLTYAEQKVLEVARAFAGRPTLMLLDEPVAGLSKVETDAMLELIVQIRDKGVSILLVEHNMTFVSAIADKVIVLNYGQKISEGSTTKIKNDPRVIQAYLGVD